ncbi:YncE family protein [Sphingomonas abietis]|uniref:Gluconolactonase n=1 Tax=Sphingomonas abietis TaxID=3012344 RepID=A0ABY7NKH3_9SPHN|nr:gluconolactonase [Sphingomonas abietis]WBO21300.1 gluconolactonase [Sphingomonas abietis]
MRLSALVPLLLSSATLAAAPASTVTTTLPGPDGGWDYAGVDAAHAMLYVARATSVTAFDLADGGKARSIGAIAHGHAVLPLPGDRLLLTSGDDNSVRILRAADGTELAHIAVGQKPDGAVFDAASGKAYVMAAKDGVVDVIDTRTAKMIGTVALKPGLEFPALDNRGTLFVNNEDENEIETVDTRTMKAGAPIALPGCEAPSGLAYDAKTGRLISACDNGKAAIIDARARKLVALLDIGQGPDAVILDAARRLAWIPCGKSGEIDRIALDGAAGPRVVAMLKTEVGARTGALDPRTGHVYLPTAAFGVAASGQARPPIMPGTFHVLVVNPATTG